MALKLVVISFIRRDFITSYTFTAMLLFFMHYSVFGKIDNYSARIFMC